MVHQKALAPACVGRHEGLGAVPALSAASKWKQPCHHLAQPDVQELRSLQSVPWWPPSAGRRWAAGSPSAPEPFLWAPSWEAPRDAQLNEGFLGAYGSCPGQCLVHVPSTMFRMVGLPERRPRNHPAPLSANSHVCLRPWRLPILCPRSHPCSRRGGHSGLGCPCGPGKIARRLDGAFQKRCAGRPDVCKSLWAHKMPRTSQWQQRLCTLVPGPPSSETA